MYDQWTKKRCRMQTWNIHLIYSAQFTFDLLENSYFVFFKYFNQLPFRFVYPLFV